MRSCGLLHITSKLRDLFLPTNKPKPFHFLPIIKYQLRLYSLKSFSPYANALSFTGYSNSCFFGAKIHANIIKLGLVDDIFLRNNLINMYVRCGVLGNGFKVFNEMNDKNLYSWTLMISGLIHNGEHELGLDFYVGMLRSGEMPNEFGVGSVLKACAAVGAYRFGSSVHCFTLKVGVERDLYVGGSVLNMYAKCEDIQSAKRVFGLMPDPDVACWNVMIGGYVQCGHGIEALDVVRLMLRSGMSMDCFTLINALKGCSAMGDLDLGKRLHGLIIKTNTEARTSLMNCLIDMYFGIGWKDYALKVFRRIKNKDVISWNTVFSHLFEDMDKREVKILFCEFMLGGVTPNAITFTVLFRQCGKVLALDLALQLYCLAMKFGLCDEVNVVDSIIYMFSRCKHMEKARKLFDTACFNAITTWNELISGYCLNNRYMEALEIFAKLRGLRVESNEYTFSGILEVCSKSQNQQVFRQIHGTVIKYGYSSSGHVCSLLINGYVKFGLLGDSFQFFDGFDSLDFVSWGTMISALAREGHICEGIRLMRTFVEAGGKLDEFIFGSILNYCADVSSYHLTKAVHSIVIKTGLGTQPFVASGVIDAYAKCGDIDGAKTAYGQSLQLNDVVVFNTMIIGYAHHGLVEEAMEIFKTMKLSNLRPSQATFVSCIFACNHMGLVEEGLRLFVVMISDYKMEPSQDVYGCVVDMLSRNGWLECGRQILEEMPYAPWPAILRSFLSGCRIHGNRKLGEWTAQNLARIAPEDDAPFVLLSKLCSETGNWEDATKIRSKMHQKGLSKDTGYCWIEM